MIYLIIYLIGYVLSFAYCINNIRKNYDVRRKDIEMAAVYSILSCISLVMEIILTIGDETVVLKKKKRNLFVL